jgi:hypothetical protein
MIGLESENDRQNELDVRDYDVRQRVGDSAATDWNPRFRKFERGARNLLLLSFSNGRSKPE